MYRLNYNLNGGTGVPAIQTQNNNNSFTILIPSKDGKIFEGWYTDSGFTSTRYKEGDIISITSGTEITLYAKWIDNIEANMIEYNRTWGSVTIQTIDDALDYLYEQYN